MFRSWAQIARGDPFDHGQGLAQRVDDLLGNGPGSDHAEERGQQGGKAQRAFGLRRFAVTQCGLLGRQLLAQDQQQATLLGHMLERGRRVVQGTAEGPDCATVFLERVAGLAQVGQMSGFGLAVYRDCSGRCRWLAVRAARPPDLPLKV